MTIFDSLRNAFNTIGHKLGWAKENNLPKQESLKRRHRYFNDEDEDDELTACQILTKRARWMSDPPPFFLCSKTPLSSSTVNGSRVMENTENIHSRVPSGNTSVDNKTPLSNHNSEMKSTVFSGPVHTPVTGAIRKPSHVRQRSENSSNHATSNSSKPMAFVSRSSSSHRTTALDETFSIQDRSTYSRLLAEYHNVSRSRSSVSKQFPFVSSIGLKSNKLKSDTVIDLTTDERSQVKVKPYQVSPAADEVAVLEGYKVPRVNSLESTFSTCSMVDPNWIMDIQRKYGEKERGQQREIEEEKMKRDLYAKHNQESERLNERILRHLSIREAVLEDIKDEALPELTPQMLEDVRKALQPKPSHEVLASAFSLNIKRSDIQTLHGLNWLNDEVINFYMNLIMERGKEEKYPNVYAFNTFFYPKLVKEGYSSLRRWTKKTDVFSYKLLVVPIHLGVHWCLAVIDFEDKRIKYFDSMGSRNNQCLEALRDYLVDESMDKKKIKYDVSSWTLENVRDIPQQHNGSDCGVFSCTFAEYISRNAKFTFTQKDMPKIRQKMIYEIISKKLM